MDKERLEEIKQKFIDSPDDDITLLISTVEEQEKSNRKLDKLNIKLMNENARLREAVNEIHFQASIVETPDNVYEAITQALKE